MKFNSLEEIYLIKDPDGPDVILGSAQEVRDYIKEQVNILCEDTDGKVIEVDIPVYDEQDPTGYYWYLVEDSDGCRDSAEFQVSRCRYSTDKKYYVEWQTEISKNYLFPLCKYDIIFT